MARTSINEELLLIVKEMMKQQADVLKVAMETQKAQADVLNKWIGMFTPSQQPLKSTTADERALIKEEMELGEWEPMNAPLFPSAEELENL